MLWMEWKNRAKVKIIISWLISWSDNDFLNGISGQRLKIVILNEVRSNLRWKEHDFRLIDFFFKRERKNWWKNYRKDDIRIEKSLKSGFLSEKSMKIIFWTKYPWKWSLKAIVESDPWKVIIERKKNCIKNSF